MTLQSTIERKIINIKQTLDESLDLDLEIPSRIQDPSLKPFLIFKNLLIFESLAFVHENLINSREMTQILVLAE